MSKTIGNILYQLRVDFGESQEQVADATNISRVAYTRYENGQREPKASYAIRLAQHFGVTVEYLYGDEAKIKGVTPSREDELIRLFRLLNAEGKEKLIDYADDLVQSEKYTRHSTPEVAAGA